MPKKPTDPTPTSPVSEEEAQTAPGARSVPAEFEPVVAAAIAAMKLTGAPASIAIAQAALESGWGKYLSASCNYLGIKWFEGCEYPHQDSRTREWNGKTLEPVVSRFVAFPTAADCFAYYGRFLMDPHGIYTEAVLTWDKSHDAYKFLQRLAIHYATDPSYVEKVWSIVEEYGLTHFDLSAAVGLSTEGLK